MKGSHTFQMRDQTLHSLLLVFSRLHIRKYAERDGTVNERNRPVVGREEVCFRLENEIVTDFELKQDTHPSGSSYSDSLAYSKT
jgi:hypothetical protein